MTSDKNVLKGITMSVVEDIANENGSTFKRMPISADFFESADEVFITSSSGGITATDKTGVVTEFLIAQYEKKKTEYATEL